MPQPTKGPRFGGSPAHQRIILANLASQLFQHGKITTTEAKAKRVQPLADRLISKAKRGDLHNRRIVLQTITDKGVVHVLFTEIAPKLAEREGGYTRITKIGPRKGDNAPMAVIELCEPLPEQAVAEATAAAKRAAKDRVERAETGGPVAAAAAADVVADKVVEHVEAAADEAVDAVETTAHDVEAAVEESPAEAVAATDTSDVAAADAEPAEGADKA